jgi:hypothetical protein
VNTDERPISKWPWPIDTAVLITLLSVALTAIKLMTVAGGDPETAYAILQAQGTGTVIIGALLTSIGFVIAPIGVALIATPSKTTVGSRPGNHYMLGFLLLIVAAFTTPWFQLLVIAGSTLLVWLIVEGTMMASMVLAGVPKWKRQMKFQSNYLITLSLTYICFAIAGAFINSTPWLPTEKISLHGYSPMTGYVLARDDSQIVVLRYRTWVIQNVPTREVTSVQECTTHYYWREETVIGLLFKLRLFPFGIANGLPQHYPSCPEAASRTDRSSLLPGQVGKLRAEDTDFSG